VEAARIHVRWCPESTITRLHVFIFHSDEARFDFIPESRARERIERFARKGVRVELIGRSGSTINSLREKGCSNVPNNLQPLYITSVQWGIQRKRFSSCAEIDKRRRVKLWKN
jgi:hypothetical protein